MSMLLKAMALSTAAAALLIQEPPLPDEYVIYDPTAFDPFPGIGNRRERRPQRAYRPERKGRHQYARVRWRP